jgi:hypothetical protein
MRPRGASPNRIPLVPSYQACTSPDLTHGPPLAYGSCSAPKLASSYLTVGTPDANGAPARSISYLRLAAVQGNTSTPEDEADVRIDAVLSDVSSQGPVLTDYLGDLQLRALLRVTDKLSGDSNSDPATLRDFLFKVRIPCTATTGPEGSTCETHTSADSVLPGMVVESKRTIWDIQQLRVYDGGSDGSISTSGNTLFATQGLFIP